MDYLCEIRVSERASRRLGEGLYHLFWNNQQPGEDKPSDEMQLLLGSFAERQQKRLTKHWQGHRTELLQHYEYEYGSLQKSFAFEPNKGLVRAEVLHPLFVTRDAAPRLTIGHVTDLHVDVRADVYEHNLQPAQVGSNYNNWNRSVRGVYDAAKDKSDVLLLTGDLIDYGRGFWGLKESRRLGEDSFYVVDRNWSLFYHLIASGDETTRSPCTRVSAITTGGSTRTRRSHPAHRAC